MLAQCSSNIRAALVIAASIAAGACASVDTTVAERFCLEGEIDLGTRYQGLSPAPGEWYPLSLCVVSEDTTARVEFAIDGASNPDMHSRFTVHYLPPDRVRIVQRDAPPDIEFTGRPVLFEALRHRRIDPRRLVEELHAHPDWQRTREADGWRVVAYPGSQEPARVQVIDNRLRALHTAADLPLRGRAPVTWTWTWPRPDLAEVTVAIDAQPVFRGRATWSRLARDELDAVFAPSGDDPARQAPADAWPARIDMQLETLAEGVHLVRGVRTGFHHLVVETAEGLVVGDAPTGWVELFQIPPADLVPGLGVSGLSERLIDFLGERFPGAPVRAVALTHAHDDHAGGARAFAAAGARVYAPAADAAFLEVALNGSATPPDRLLAAGGRVTVTPVHDTLELADPARRVVLMEMGSGPHSTAALGLFVPAADVFFQSDVHVARSDADAPRAVRAGTECWFARWAVVALPRTTVVHSSHTTVATPVHRLARYLESPLCQAQDSP